jgi:hypothetical protein
VGVDWDFGGENGGRVVQEQTGTNSFLCPFILWYICIFYSVNHYISKINGCSTVAPPTILDNPDKDPSESTDPAEMEDFGPLHEAACTGKIDTCKYLVEELGFDINCEANNDSGMCMYSS